MPAAETAGHRALGDDRRGHIVAELEAAGRALDVHELADRLGLHANTVRWHLGVLGEAGLVRSRRAPRATPGRPRVVFELQRSAAEVYAEEAGLAWGHERARLREPDAEVGEAEAIERVVELLAEQGFEPRALGRRIEMRRCPFQDLARTAPEVVCAVHRGLISGALAELGQPLAVGELELFPRPGVCIAYLEPIG